MGSLFYTLMMVFLWCVNMVNGTGIGKAYHTTEIATLAAVIIAVFVLAYQALHDGDILVQPRYFYVIVPMIVQFVAVSLLNDRKLEGMSSFWVFLLTYILSKTRPNATAVRMTGICYGVLGLGVLLIYSYTDILAGWNGNSIGMIGLFSFLTFCIPFFGMREWRSFVMMPLVGAAYMVLILPTDSRSCIIVIIVMILLVLGVIPVGKLLRSSKAIALVLMVPLFVAIGVCMLSTFGDISGLTEWSQEYFGKDAFSGRDYIWMDGFNRIKIHPFFGNGQILAGYWHNSAIACLVAFGGAGYFLWNRLFHLILLEGQPYLDDTMVYGSIVAFLALACQQSVELGLFSSVPSMLPYLILGILLGRVNYLKHDR